MPKSPLERLFDAIEWNPLEGHLEESAMPHATHEGILDMGSGLTLRVYQLSNGQRIIKKEDFEEFFGITQEQDTNPADEPVV